MTAKKRNGRDCLSHTASREAWLQKHHGERVSYDGKAKPRQINWQTADSYDCPELHHRSAGQAARPVTLNTR